MVHVDAEVSMRLFGQTLAQLRNISRDALPRQIVPLTKLGQRCRTAWACHLGRDQRGAWCSL